MTIDALHGPVDRPRDQADAGPAIGTADANIFLCPRCTRPLAVGVSRCAGCRTRLVYRRPAPQGQRLRRTRSGPRPCRRRRARRRHDASRPAGGGAVAPPTAVGPSVAPIASAVTVPSGAPAPSVAPVNPAIPPAALTGAAPIHDREPAVARRCRPLSRRDGKRAPTRLRSHRCSGTWRRLPRSAIGSRRASDMGCGQRCVSGPRRLLRLDRPDRGRRTRGVP
jgi:hypothetical protein